MDNNYPEPNYYQNRIIDSKQLKQIETSDSALKNTNDGISEINITSEDQLQNLDNT